MTLLLDEIRTYKWSSLVFIALNLGCYLVNVRQKYEETVGKKYFWVKLGVCGPDAMAPCPKSHLSCGKPAITSLVIQ